MPGHDVRLSSEAVAPMRAELPRVAERVVDAVIEEVPSYADAFDSEMAATIRNAVQLALSGFLTLAGGRRGADTPRAPAVEGSYQLGRGEARSGRSTDALLSAFRIGARVAWREMSGTAVEHGVDGIALVEFADLVFAYIDELSAAAVAGHTDELATSGRVRQRLLERMGRHLLAGASPEVVHEAAQRAEWEPPSTLTAVIVPESQVRPVLSSLPAATVVLPEAPDLTEGVLLLVPDVHDAARAAVLRAVEGRGAVVGPARAWLAARGSYQRALRARLAGLGPDTEQHLPRLVLDADADALVDLRARALAPLADVRPSTAEKLTETLRAWVLHQGRRDEMAEALFVHPQTVRYRLQRLRELYGDALEDPDTVLALTLALA
ncbi:helix-turn-helix domain-containing protein [Nocardioides sp. CBS4Y-1]|uniref:Helix-turn-helix domain-containing protein n=2 Tax=Nocardioides acrostichi TaxID=2784339 RepID=A0A930Y5G2_9ACTN|nr:helix-turn-helix domain-containing protein [Nocardioides acrostichi]